MKDLHTAQPGSVPRNIWTQPLPPLGQWPHKLAGCLGLQISSPAAGPQAAMRRRRRSASAEPLGADDWPLACGWHSSSQDLHKGLQVLELPVEERPA